MKKISREHGFTLLEIIVVLAVIGALAAMLAPVVFRYIDDAKRQQAQSDVHMIAASINQMYKDTGRYPFYKNGIGALKLTAADDVVVLSSNEACGAAAATLALDLTAPAVGTSGVATTALCDSLADQLIKNLPTLTGTPYALTGARAWKGPYLERIPTLDPWGRSYLVNIGNADPSAETFATLKWVVAISAGPDGVMQTVLTALASSNPQVAGDDVIARVK